MKNLVNCLKCRQNLFLLNIRQETVNKKVEFHTSYCKEYLLRCQRYLYQIKKTNKPLKKFNLNFLFATSLFFIHKGTFILNTLTL